jgi:predicted metal-dependent hydrolase
MEKLNLKNAAAFGNAAFTRLDRAEALYEELVERLYAIGEDVASRIESPERVADALIKAAQAHVGRRNGYRLAEKALVTAHRIVSKIAPADNARIIAIYKLLGHVCCRQGKHREAMKYNALALLLQVNPQPISLRSGQ